MVTKYTVKEPTMSRQTCFTRVWTTRNTESQARFNSCCLMLKTLTSIWSDCGEEANMSQMSSMSWPPGWVLWYSTTSCSVIAFTPLLLSSYKTSRGKLLNRYGESETIRAWHCGLETIKFCRVFNPGVGDPLSIKRTISSFSKLISVR